MLDSGHVTHTREFIFYAFQLIGHTQKPMIRRRSQGSSSSLSKVMTDFSAFHSVSAGHDGLMPKGL